MDINRVRYFLAFCESLNFSQTARRLNMSQPALTRALLKLEGELGPPDHFSTRAAVSLQEIMGEPYLDRLKCEFRGVFVEACRNQNISSESAILCENDEWIQSLIRAGAGVSIMPRESVIIDGLAHTAIEGENMERVVSLVMATGREDTPDIRNFMQAAREYAWQE